MSSVLLVVAGVLVLALAGFVGTLPAAAQGLERRDRATREALRTLGAGRLLVAARDLSDPNFARTVILLVAHGDRGAMGLIVNRRTEVTLRQLFPHLTPTVATGAAAFVGGPVGRGEAVALVRGARPPADARSVIRGVSLVSSRETIESMLASAVASELRVYVGHAGWGPGQLEGETARGSWHVVDAEVDVVFDGDPSMTWERQIARTESLRAQSLAPFGRRGPLAFRVAAAAAFGLPLTFPAIESASGGGCGAFSAYRPDVLQSGGP